MEISEIDGRFAQQYEEKLYQSLQEIREQYEIDLENKNEEIKSLYEEKLRSLDSQLARNSKTAATAVEELRAINNKMEEINRKLLVVEAEKDSAIQRTRDLEKELEHTKLKYMNEFNAQDKEVNSTSISLSSV